MYRIPPISPGSAPLPAGRDLLHSVIDAAAAPLYLARATAPVGDALTSGDIQLFPPGTHDVTASTLDGTPVNLTITADAAGAAALEASRAKHAAEAAANTGDAPYLDLNHDDREAAAWVQAIYWGGDDPLTGGIRAKVEWTAAGRAAVEGKTYRRVSPVFHSKDGKLTAAPANMGGLVNRAAFRTIAPLFAKQTTIPDTMTAEESTALMAENEALKKQLAELQATLAKLEKADAEATVAAAAKEGRIAADPAVQAKWVAGILADPGAKELLASLPANPLLAAKAAPATTPETTTAKQADSETVADAAAILAKYNSLPRGDEKETFFAKHRETLIQAREATLR